MSPWWPQHLLSPERGRWMQRDDSNEDPRWLNWYLRAERCDRVGSGEGQLVGSYR